MSISPTEAGNSTTVQEAGTGLEQKTLVDSKIQMLGDIQNLDIGPEEKTLIDSEIHALKNTEMDSEHKSDSENSVASQDNSGNNLDPNIGADINAVSPKCTVSTSDQNTGAGSNNLKSSDQNELSLEQKSTVKSNTAATVGTNSMQQKTGADTSKETKSSGNQAVISKPKTVINTCSGTKSSVSEGEKPKTVTNGDASAKNNVPSGGAQKEQSSYATTTSQKTDTNLVSYSINSSSNLSSINPSSNLSSINLSSNLSSINLSSNLSSINLSSDLSSINLSSNLSSINLSSNLSSINSSSDQSSINSGSDLSSINSGSDLSSTDSGSGSGGPSYGSAHVIKNTELPNTELSTPVIEKPKPTVDIAEAIGVKDIQPKIEGQVAQANVTSPPSNMGMGSFLIGILGAFIIVFIIILALSI